MQTELTDTGQVQSTRFQPVLVYLLIAFGLAWAVQIAVSMAVLTNPEAQTVLGTGGLLVALLLMWPPAIGAYVARRWFEGNNFADAGLRIGPWRYIVIAWFGPAILTVLAILLSLPIYPFDSSFSTLRQMAENAGQPLPASPEIIVIGQIVSGLTIGTIINSIFAFGEEFGWRGYLLPRLMSLLGPWPGILAHGAIWGFWHAPLIFLIGYNYPGHPQLGVPLFIVFGTLSGILFAWLRLASNSVVPPTIAHAALNAIAGLGLLLLHDVDPAIGGVIYSPIGWLVLIAAIGLLLVTGAFRSAMMQQRHASPAVSET